jgi:hypothetical protein
MGIARGDCTACDQSFDLDDKGNIPEHTKPIVGKCCGSCLPPFVERGLPPGFDFSRYGRLFKGDSPSQQKRKQREMESGIWPSGHSGSGKRR